jgi:hypothetical protein
MTAQVELGYEIVDFSVLPGVDCPCGTARRAFADVPDFPGTIHVTEIAAGCAAALSPQVDRDLLFLGVRPDAQMQLDDQIIPVHPGMCILIRPGTRHRAMGRMRVLIVVLPSLTRTTNGSISSFNEENRHELENNPDGSAFLRRFARCAAGDWAHWRGPEQNGISRETNLVDDWSLTDNKNVLWVSEIGGRSTPIV